MNTIINQENGVIWINVNDSTLGIPESFETFDILDADGLKFEDDTFTILESNGAELDEDFENETTTLHCENGRLVFSFNHIEVIQ